ncbi:DUF3472 domain-containing protein [Prolixibacteraceae bacterium Z1-6]|uniref:DUF3472 domain-containing protein n=1 Tax=Draconibacterium aestuarii TaxID=2998507 RepID=A0A9X3FCS9_9BACT|nr:DUF3472 domain-containing protein [Prolixibacteraceae bacterium Z1-6]
MKNTIQYVFFLLVIASACNNSADEFKNDVEYTYSVPIYGNSWVIDDISKNHEVIGEKGLTNWTDPDTKIRIYFKTENKGALDVAFVAKSMAASEIEVSLGKESKQVKYENTGLDTLVAGRFKITEPGYHSIEVQGVEKSGAAFPEIQNVLIGGEATTGKVWFVKEDFYWGRRGPSVHLQFQVPGQAGDVAYFYNEINVPEGNDVLGSYFMANGFGQGYFGIQVNSADERRVLFSVWSPYNTDNPSEIPADQRIKLLKKGEGVQTGEFGNEGSGGQSYYKFMWKAGTTYKFLLKGKPAGNDFTDFTAWFFAPEVNEWKLIASFSRPKTNTYLTSLYSFLENFYTNTGHLSRLGNFGNQWIYTTNNEWIELTKIKFTADATARKESRMDYAGGVNGNQFFLKNCGFFSETTPVDSYFERQDGGLAPVINFEDLP